MTLLDGITSRLVDTDRLTVGILQRMPGAELLGDPIGRVPGNVHVLVPHVACAAAELPVTRDDEQWFGPGLEGVLEVLVARGLLRKRPGGWFWTRPDRPGEHVSLLGAVANIVIWFAVFAAAAITLYRRGGGRQ